MIETDYLAPDTINEMLHALNRMEEAVGLAYQLANPRKKIQDTAATWGRHLLEEASEVVEKLDILLTGVENSRRPVRLQKVVPAYDLFRRLIRYHAVDQMMKSWELRPGQQWNAFKDRFKDLKRAEWRNISGQLMPDSALQKLIKQIKQDKIGDWPSVHAYYDAQQVTYPKLKFEHAVVSALESERLKPASLSKRCVMEWVEEAVETRSWMMEKIRTSRLKDHQQAFRKMMYDTQEEMDQVIGKFEDNAFIQSQEEAGVVFKNRSHAFSAWMQSK
jgi:hypothetical protein